MASESSTPAAASGGWYVVVAGSTPAGPYTEQILADMLCNGHITVDTVVWAEGQPAWVPLKDVPDMQPYIEAATAERKRPANANKKSKNAPDDVLAAFQAEISAIEEAEAEAPPEDEREFEDDDGTVYVWNSELKKFLPKDDTAATVASTQQQQPADAARAAPSKAHDYNPEDMVYVPEEELIPSLAEARAAQAAELAAADGGEPVDLEREAARKPHPKRPAPSGAPADAAGPGRAAGDGDGAGEASTSGKENGGVGEGGVRGAGGKRQKGNEAADQPSTWFELKVNTSVYITGLPDDVTVEEIVEVFSKCGIIKDDDAGQPRVKLYRDKATGVLKGDGLVTYLREPSVGLAEQILDGVPLRLGGGPPMSVKRAQFEMKGEKFVPKAKGGGNKKKAKQQAAKVEKLLGWHGADERIKAEDVTVVLRNMFHPDELLVQPGAAEELEVDVKAECSKMGAVDKVRVYKSHPEGVVTVRFVMEEGTKACLSKMQGRWFGGRQVQASMWDGKTNFNVKVEETAEEQEARLEAFARSLEQM